MSVAYSLSRLPNMNPFFLKSVLIIVLLILSGVCSEAPKSTAASENKTPAKRADTNAAAKTIPKAADNDQASENKAQAKRASAPAAVPAVASPNQKIPDHDQKKRQATRIFTFSLDPNVFPEHVSVPTVPKKGVDFSTQATPTVQLAKLPLQQDRPDIAKLFNIFKMHANLANPLSGVTFTPLKLKKQQQSSVLAQPVESPELLPPTFQKTHREGTKPGPEPMEVDSGNVRIQVHGPESSGERFMNNAKDMAEEHIDKPLYNTRFDSLEDDSDSSEIPWKKKPASTTDMEIPKPLSSLVVKSKATTTTTKKPSKTSSEEDSSDKNKKDSKDKCPGPSDISHGVKNLHKNFWDSNTWSDSIKEVGSSMKKAVKSVGRCAKSMWKGVKKVLGIDRKRSTLSPDEDEDFMESDDAVVLQASRKRSFESVEKSAIVFSNTAWDETKKVAKKSEKFFESTGDSMKSWWHDGAWPIG